MPRRRRRRRRAAGDRARPHAGRQPRRRQPLPRAAGGRRGLRRARRRAAFGVAAGQVVVMIHSGSRGFGHQICTDHLQRMAARPRRVRLRAARPPARLRAGRARRRAATTWPPWPAPANFAFANRQMMMHEVRGAFEQVFAPAVGAARRASSSTTWRTTSPSSRSTRSTARERAVWVHRKGATRAFGPGRPERARRLPRRRPAGDHPRRHGHARAGCWSGTETAMRETFGSTCHGAGRRCRAAPPSRSRAAPRCAASWRPRASSCRRGSTGLLAEEAPYAYKDVADVVDVVHDRRLWRARSRGCKPLGVLKG